MSIVSLAWSAPFREKFEQGRIKGTVLLGACNFIPGQEALVFVAKEGNVLEAKEAFRLGKAIIKEVRIVKVGKLGKREAELTGNQSIEELKTRLHKWYQASDETVVTFLELKIKKIEKEL